MSRTWSLFALTLLIAGCGGAPVAAIATVASAPARKPGAILLALPGAAGARPSASLVSGAAHDVIRGRVRWHLDDDGGATRAREVTREPIRHALALPAWLGSGIALVSDSGLATVSSAGVIRPIVRGEIGAMSIGATALWARAREGGDWLRIDLAPNAAPNLASNAASIAFEPPPIAAPIHAGIADGHALSAGPEFISPKVGFAIVDLLGPIFTRDGGDTWTPLDRDAVATAFPLPGGPTRLLREPSGLFLASEAAAAPLSPSGQIGAPSPIDKTHDAPPDVGAIRLETAAVRGVALDDGDVLVSDGARLALASLDPVRVLRASRQSELMRCELRVLPSPRAPVAAGAPEPLALAVCAAHDESPSSSGSQLVVGTVVDGASGLRVVAEKSFAFPSAFQLTSVGAVAVAGACVGSEAGGPDLRFVAKVCVRDRAGEWHDVSLPATTGRLAVVPRLDGGVLVAREDPALGTVLLALPAGASPGATPIRLSLESVAIKSKKELLALDEIASGRFALWRKIGALLEPTVIEVGKDGAPRILARPSPRVLEDGSVIGIDGAHAMVATWTRGKAAKLPKGAPPAIVADPSARITGLVISYDAGAKWVDASWPEEAPLLDLPTSERLDCGALGCRMFGWARVGWDAAVASHDELIDRAAAPELPTASSPPTRAGAISVRCSTALVAASFDPHKVPTLGSVSAIASPALGYPPPSVGAGQSLQITPFSPGAVRGGVFAWGPTSGEWRDLARVQLRFASDFDPIGVVNETVPVAAPFADRVGSLRPMVTAYALGPGRILVTIGDFAKPIGGVYRVSAGAPLERIDLSSLGDLVQITNARELGGTLLIVGLAVPHETKLKSAYDAPPFAALISSSGIVSQTFARATMSNEGGLVATSDPGRGRFGLSVRSPLPTWQGGSVYALPIQPDGKPMGSFEKLVAGASDLARPTAACSPTISAWDRGEQNQSRTLHLSIDGKPATLLVGYGTVLRERLSATEACLDRLTVIGAHAAFQLDPASGRAVLLAIDDKDDKVGHKTELQSCAVEWE